MGQVESEEDREVGLSQIQELYKKFAEECPSGKLHLHEFKRIFGITKDSTEEESAYMENLFRSFDANQVHITSVQPPIVSCRGWTVDMCEDIVLVKYNNKAS